MVGACEGTSGVADAAVDGSAIRLLDFQDTGGAENVGTLIWYIFLKIDTFSMEIYHYIVHSSSAPYDKFLENIFKFSHLLIRGLIKGLSPN